MYTSIKDGGKRILRIFWMRIISKGFLPGPKKVGYGWDLKYYIQEMLLPR